jgi:galactose mutarotase-like enzyme
MPYAVGLHPGFQWPLAGGDKDDYAIRFDHPEKREVPVIAPGGLFSDLTRPAAFSDSRTLPLAEEVFAREALCFLDAASSALDLIGPRGRALRIETSGFPHIVLWSRPGAPFLCIETWSGYGDPEHFSGELAEKPSMILLAPAEERLHSVTYTAGAS